MKYMLLIYHDERAWEQLNEAERQKIYSEYRQLTQDIITSGQHLAGSQLQGTSTATSIRVRDEKQIVTDGPFAETKEQLAGYFLIETNSPEEAMAIAARVPTARVGTIEVRPLA
ncbi:MAG: YciI family protein [Acidobacteriota bacterium]|nr:YciI family protein [Acidobacteriota bacterium]